MIDPKDFLKVPQPVDNGLVQITGNFICQSCMESIGFALFNEDEMKLFYTCNAGHENEATL
jgi:hypothetical protein